ncbi:hypothetical protein OEA41_006170 [Lepraria neglecta]|uniref:HIT domain-containing protein n=1 Tax=Lepraria neglecta TaxID=209136 RepID=A0AAD9Z7H3_9LECA|nr:hypothetical protein OEA41_006170 [Lepraria neglecta]
MASRMVFPQEVVQQLGQKCPSQMNDDEFAEMLTITPLLEQHKFFYVNTMYGGFTNYPITRGHILFEGRFEDLMSLTRVRFLRVFEKVRHISRMASRELEVERCGLACDGSRYISLIPLHGLAKEWKPVIFDEHEFHDTFPGYLTTKNGPVIDDATLVATQSRIADVSRIKKPYDNHFDGDLYPLDQNVFARLVRGEVPQWRIWEDNTHIAFLTPYGNTPGYTVLVPRKHLASDIFGIDSHDYYDLVSAAYTVAHVLKKAFGVARCGMFFEGYEIDYAHVKLVPVHSDGSRFMHMGKPNSFYEKYPGYLTTQLGPMPFDDDELVRMTNIFRDSLEADKTPTGSNSNANNSNRNSYGVRGNEDNSSGQSITAATRLTQGFPGHGSNLKHEEA